MSVFDKKIDRVEHFTKTTEGATEEEKRDAEEHLLQPEPMLEYGGPSPKHRTELESRSALIVFRNQAQQELIGHILSVRESIGGTIYITDISVLEVLAKKVADGEMVIKGDKIDVFDPDVIPDEIKGMSEGDGILDPHTVPDELVQTLRDNPPVKPKKKKKKGKKKKDKKKKKKGLKLKGRTKRKLR